MKLIHSNKIYFKEHWYISYNINTLYQLHSIILVLRFEISNVFHSMLTKANVHNFGYPAQQMISFIQANKF